MKLKELVIITIITIILIPSSLAQIQELKTNLIVNDINELTQEGYIPVILCCGKISNLHIYDVGYTEFYAFDAKNVSCRVELSRLFPFFRHYSNGEKLRLANPMHHGILKENFVCVISL